jgi:hypothetical protein
MQIDADGEVVWSRCPDAGIKLAAKAASDGDKQAGHRGARRKPLKPFARGMPGVSGVTVVTTLVCFLFCTQGCGRAERPAFPAPSIDEGKFPENSGGQRREIVDACPFAI